MKGVVEHFAAVNDAITIPIMVQDAPLSGVTLSVPLLVRMARELENVSYFKIECPFAADKIAALIDAGGDKIRRPIRRRRGCHASGRPRRGRTGTMTSGAVSRTYPARSLPAIFPTTRIERWRVGKKCLPLINHENRQCGLRAARPYMPKAA